MELQPWLELLVSFGDLVFLRMVAYMWNSVLLGIYRMHVMRAYWDTP